MEPLPLFPLFPDPIRENVIKASNATCVLCGDARGLMYVGPCYGRETPDEGSICPWCIASGAAESRGWEFNDAVIYPSRPGVPQLNAEDSALVQFRTPGFTTWQGNHWLMCCGRACIYVGEADARDLKGRWAGAVPSLFEDLKWSEARKSEFIQGICREGSPAAYIFQCQVCESFRGYWDAD